jgi:hypothetical protein
LKGRRKQRGHREIDRRDRSRDKTGGEEAKKNTKGEIYIQRRKKES